MVSGFEEGAALRLWGHEASGTEGDGCLHDGKSGGLRSKMALTCARTCAAALFTAAQTRNQDALQQAPRGTSRPWDVTQGSKEMSSYAVEGGGGNLHAHD